MIQIKYAETEKESKIFEEINKSTDMNFISSYIALDSSFLEMKKCLIMKNEIPIGRFAIITQKNKSDDIFISFLYYTENINSLIIIINNFISKQYFLTRVNIGFPFCFLYGSFINHIASRILLDYYNNQEKKIKIHKLKVHNYISYSFVNSNYKADYDRFNLICEKKKILINNINKFNLDELISKMIKTTYQKFRDSFKTPNKFIKIEKHFYFLIKKNIKPENIIYTLDEQNNFSFLLWSSNAENIINNETKFPLDKAIKFFNNNKTNHSKILRLVINKNEENPHLIAELLLNEYIKTMNKKEITLSYTPFFYNKISKNDNFYLKFFNNFFNNTFDDKSETFKEDIKTSIHYEIIKKSIF